MLQKLKFWIITLLLNDEQRANLTMTLLRRKGHREMSRKELQIAAVKEGHNTLREIRLLIWDAAAFGPEDY